MLADALRALESAPHLSPLAEGVAHKSAASLLARALRLASGETAAAEAGDAGVVMEEALGAEEAEEAMRATAAMEDTGGRGAAMVGGGGGGYEGEMSASAMLSEVLCAVEATSGACGEDGDEMPTQPTVSASAMAELSQAMAAAEAAKAGSRVGGEGACAEGASAMAALEAALVAAAVGDDPDSGLSDRRRGWSALGPPGAKRCSERNGRVGRRRRSGSRGDSCIQCRSTCNMAASMSVCARRGVP